MRHKYISVMYEMCLRDLCSGVLLSQRTWWYEFVHDSSSQIDRYECRQYVALCLRTSYIDRYSQLPFHIWLYFLVRSSYSFTVYIAFSLTHMQMHTRPTFVFQWDNLAFSAKRVSHFSITYSVSIRGNFCKHSNCEIAICVNVKVSYCRLVAFHFVVFISFNLNRLCN